MLQTALKPKWLAILALSLIIATAFVLLSKWQFEQAENTGPVAEVITEDPVPLTDHIDHGEPLYENQADQIVTLSGEYLPDTTVYITPRLKDGVEGYWVVSAFEVDDADGNVIPVVRGWAEHLDQARANSVPEGQLDLEGRLLPADAPANGQRPDVDVFRSLSTAELINVWDQPSYNAVVVAFDTTNTAGTEISAADQNLQAVYVGPQPAETQLNLLNVFYAVEWVFFAGFALFLWWRMVRDDHRKDLAEAEADKAWAEQWYREQGYIKEEHQS